MKDFKHVQVYFIHISYSYSELITAQLATINLYIGI